MTAISRTSIVAMLVAVEVLVAGLCIWSLTNAGAGWGGMGLHRVDYNARPFAPIAAGPSPVVTIDDVDSHVVVSASTDGLVHVTDETAVHGWIAGSDQAQVLTASRTPDGVRIFRPEGHFVIGDTNDRVLVQVPPMSRLEIVRSDACDISGIRNGASVHTNDGHITATDVSGNAFDFDSGDGRVTISNISFTGNAPHMHVRTADGSVHVSGAFGAPGAYSVETGDGRVDVTLLSGSNVTVSSSTGDGSITIDGNRHAGSTVKVGNGDAAMNVHTEDGSIHITTNGA